MQDYVEGKGKEDVLGSLEEDEGDESEEDESGDDHDDDDSSEEDRKKEGREAAKELSFKGKAVPTEEEKELGEVSSSPPL